MNADRNLLFGILAVQAGFVKSDRLAEAMNAWTLTKERPLGDILKERGDLSAARHDLVAALVAEQLAQHGGDAAASLAALESATPTKDALRAVADADVQASLGATVTEVKPAAAAIARSYADRHGGGRFRIIKPHAKGGLGEVFLAEDGEIKRNVALKEIRSDKTADQGSIGRFVKEAEITGQLEHPGVVPIYGAGTYGDGRPFYAMRFVQGMELKQAIADFHQASGGRQSPEPSSNSSDSRSRLGGLSSPARRFARREFRDLLGRFIDVCQAVAYAHSRGVLHRDLKPGNVMLGKYGETLVVDWGLAKVVGRDDPTGDEATVQPSSGDTGETLPGNVLGTPVYMSPEQAAGKIGELGPATDIYALGAILHCILTGKPPVEPGLHSDVLRRVKEGKILPSGDAPKPLAAVARRAMSLSPDARYKSALDLAAEVEHWLADEPVAAYRDPPLAKAARWTRKHPATTGASASVGLMLLLGLGAGLTMASQFNALLQERNEELVASRKEVREALNATADGVIEDLLAGKQQLTDKERRYLEDVAKRYEAFASKAGDSSEALYFQAAGLYRIGYIRYRLGLTADAESALAKAKALCEKLTDANPALSHYQRYLAQSHSTMAVLYKDTGRLKEAETAHASALAIREKLAAANPSVAEYQNDLASSFSGMGALYGDTGRSKEAEEALFKSFKIRERLAAANPSVAEYQYDLAQCYDNLGALYSGTGRMNEAETALGKALSLFEKLAAANPSVADHQFRLALSQHNLGGVYRDTGRKKEAELAWSKALALCEKLAVANPSATEYQRHLAHGNNNLGALYSETGRMNEAETALGKALSLFEKLAAANPSVADHQFRLALSQHNLGGVYRATGRKKEAELAWSKALVLCEKLAAANPSLAEYQLHLAHANNNLGLHYNETGRKKEAEAALAKAMNLSGKLAAENPEVPANCRSLAVSHVYVGYFTRTSNRPADSLVHYRRAIALLEAVLTKEPQNASARQFLQAARGGEIRALCDMGRYAEAAAASLKATGFTPPR